MAPLLNLAATASLLNTSPTTVVRWVKLGSLPSIVLHQGKRKVTRRFRREDLMQIMNPGRAPGEAEGECE